MVTRAHSVDLRYPTSLYCKFILNKSRATNKESQRKKGESAGKTKQDLILQGNIERIKMSAAQNSVVGVSKLSRIYRRCKVTGT